MQCVLRLHSSGFTPSSLPIAHGGLLVDGLPAGPSFPGNCFDQEWPAVRAIDICVDLIDKVNPVKN